MNVHAPVLARSAPLDTRDDRDPPAGLHRRIVDLLARLDRGAGRDGKPDDAVEARVTRRAILLGFTGGGDHRRPRPCSSSRPSTVPIGAGDRTPALDGTALAGTDRRPPAVDAVRPARVAAHGARPRRAATSRSTCRSSARR